MAKERDDRQFFEETTGATHTAERITGISPEIRDLLRTANIPLEFKALLRATEFPSLTPVNKTEHVPIFAETEEDLTEPAVFENTAALEWLKSNELLDEEWQQPEIDHATEIESEAFPVHDPARPVELPESIDGFETARLSYLSEMTLDMQGVAHMTPGLQSLAGKSISGLVSASYLAFWLPDDGILYTDSDDFGRTVERTNCKMVVFFKIDILQKGKVILPNARFSDFRPELKLYQGASLVMRISANDIKGLPGKLIIEWKQNGKSVKFINIKKAGQQAQEKNQLEIGAKDIEDLKAQIKKIKEEGWAFLVTPPQPLPKPPATSQEMLEGTIKLIPDNDPQNPCEDSDRLAVIWSAAKANSVHEGPRSDYAGNNLIQIAQIPRDYTRENKRYKVFDLELYWTVKNPLNCCKTGHAYAVIQFAWARALIKKFGKFRKQVLGHDWTLDILDSEKKLARDGDIYDPRFTNNPRNSRPGTKPDIRPGKTPKAKSAVVQEDSPGISYRHFFGQNGDDGNWIPGLSGRGGCVIINFTAFLVCDSPAFQQGNPAENYKQAKVEKIIQYRIIYSFKGNGAAPNIIPQIIKVSETKCKKQFRYYLKKSKSLERAYRHPPESKIEEKENYSKENEKITFKDC